MKGQGNDHKEGFDKREFRNGVPVGYLHGLVLYPLPSGSFNVVDNSSMVGLHCEDEWIETGFVQ